MHVSIENTANDLKKLRAEADRIGNAISRNRNLLHSLQDKKKKSRMTLEQIEEVQELIKKLEQDSIDVYKKIDRYNGN